MKIWCERCKGRGELTKQTVVSSVYFVKCPCCDGKGFTDKKEIERLAEIGKATVMAYDEGYDLNVNVHPARWRFKNIQSLLEWAESEE